MAKLVGSWSKDPSTQTGAVIVRPDRSVASVGFNGFPRNMKDDPALYADREQKYSRIVHAEINALIHATGAVSGHTIYVYPLAPCDRCAVQLLQAGITRFVYPTTPEDQRGRWEPILRKASGYITEAGATQVEVPLANLDEEPRAWFPDPEKESFTCLDCGMWSYSQAGFKHWPSCPQLRKG